MRIGIDIRYALHTRRGIGSYVLNLLRKLIEIDRENQYFLYTDVDDLEGLLPLQNNFRIVKISLPRYLLDRVDPGQTKSKFFAIWEQILLPIQAYIDRLDLLHCTGNTAPVYLHPSIELVLTVHDVMFALPSTILPKPKSLYSSLFNQYCTWLLPWIVRRSNQTIAVSNYSKQDIIAYTQATPEKIQVIYPGIDPRFKRVDEQIIAEIRLKLALPVQFILAFGAPDPRKNTTTIINTFLNFCQSNADRSLVIAGVNNTYKATLLQQIDSSPFKQRITILPFVDDADLVAIYNAADLVLYPSLYEGCGFPVLEAMACGTPVIASNLTSIPEVAGDAAILIDPMDIDGITAALVKLSTDLDLRQRLIDRGYQQAQAFSWRRTAQENLKIYHAAIEQRLVPNRAIEL
jgi:glycosyltransferase involved in cell wall biosynthesis